MEQPTSGDRPDRGRGPSETAASPRRDQDAPRREVAADDTTHRTFLLTDIEGSVPLWEQDAEAMQRALLRHDAIIDEHVIRHGGTVVHQHGEGDSRFAVFSRPADAVTSVCNLQRAFQHETWPTTTPLRVRMAVHTGEAVELGGHFYGSAVNRCARLRGLAHGGQVLLSETTAGLVRSAMPNEAALRDLAEHRLRGFERPERVYQLLHPELPTDFPPLGSARSPRHNLPAQTTPLIGREVDVERVCDLLRRDDVRIVTLTGAGGVGKTRVGLQVATRLLDHLLDGVFCVPLAPIGDPELVIPTIARVLGLRETSGRPLLDTLKGHLREKRLLLLLDNFEQILPAAPLVAELLAACPGLKTLVTSRAVLHLRGEQEYALPPLACPDPKRPPQVESLAQYAAVALFVQRAAVVKSAFAITDESAPAIAEICHRVDGLPLAIELAAARIKLLSPRALLARMERRLPLLTGGAHDLPERQRTLRDTIAWSYDLLDEPERRLFRRLSVFAGGFTLESAEAVCDEDGSLGISILDGLATLLAQSLVRHNESDGGEPRFTMLETIREYGLELLEASGEAAGLRRRHGEYFIRFAAPTDAARRGPEQATWLRRLEAEHDNLRAALTWGAEASDDPNLLARIAAPLWTFWWKRGYLSEARGWLGRALARATDSSARIAALYAAGMLAFYQDDYPRARELLAERVSLCRLGGDPASIAGALESLSYVLRLSGDGDQAADLSAESLVLSRQLGDDVRIGFSLHACALVAYGQGDLDRAASAWEEALRLHREAGHTIFLPHLLHGLARVALERNEMGKAATLCEEAAEGFQQHDDMYGLHLCLISLMRIAQRRGDIERVVDLAPEVLALGRGLGGRTAIANVLGSLASVARARGDPDRSARLLGAAEALRETLGQRPSPAELRADEAEAAAVRAELGDEMFAAAWAEGRAMPLEQAIARAFEGVGSA
jgi:predicted ATPase/class 3 adenylate cyclase